MDDIRNKSLFQIGESEQGQTTVEYVLLMFVIVIAASTVFRSDLFQGLFGENGKLSSTFKSELEFSYRHTLQGRELYTPPDYSTPHSSYVQQNLSTRFFGANDFYPSK